MLLIELLYGRRPYGVLRLIAVHRFLPGRLNLVYMDCFRLSRSRKQAINSLTASLLSLSMENVAVILAEDHLNRLR